MGYRPKTKFYDLKFTDPEMEGLEVKLRGLNTGEILMADNARSEGTDELINELLEMYTRQLVSWNIEDKQGEILPLTMESVLSLDFDFNMKVIDAWKDAVVGVPTPLDSASPDGVPSLEASIPMDIPSESLAS